MDTYLPIGYGEGHLSCYPRGYELGYEHFLQTRVWGRVLLYPTHWVPIAIPR
jgi:hypothetical protein